MKVEILVVALLCGCANAGLFSGLKDSLKAIEGAVKQTATDFVPYAHQVGHDLLHQAENATTGILENSLQNILSHELDKLFHGKRNLNNDMVSELSSLLKMGTSQYGQVISEVFGQIKDIKDKLSELKIHPEEAIKQLEKIAMDHSDLKQEFLDALERDVGVVINKVMSSSSSRRNILTSLFAISHSISGAFRPIVNAVSQLVHQEKATLMAETMGLLGNVKLEMIQVGSKILPQLSQTKSDGKGVITVAKNTV